VCLEVVLLSESLVASREGAGKRPLAYGTVPRSFREGAWKWRCASATRSQYGKGTYSQQCRVHLRARQGCARCWLLCLAVGVAAVAVGAVGVAAVAVVLAGVRARGGEGRGGEERRGEERRGEERRGEGRGGEERGGEEKRRGEERGRPPPRRACREGSGRRAARQTSGPPPAREGGAATPSSCMAGSTDGFGGDRHDRRAPRRTGCSATQNRT